MAGGEMPMMEPAPPTPLEEAAVRSELAAKHRQGSDNVSNSTPQLSSSGTGARGTVLEAAFVDPGHDWPPADGQGKNAIELQASLQLLKDDDGSVFTTESGKERMRNPTYPVATEKRFLLCCRKPQDAVVSAEKMREYQEQKALAKEARAQHKLNKKVHMKEKERAAAIRQKYKTVPEGILIYRLDTTTHRLTLVSETGSNENVLTDCVVVNASAAPNLGRRSMLVNAADGRTHTLTACEQRTATAWLEAMHLMQAKDSKRGGGGLFRKGESTGWSKESPDDLHTIEDQYMSLAHYSHKLIRAGGLPHTKKGGGGAGGIYYSVEKIDESDGSDAEALEAVAKRRAVMKDSWDFYRMICSLLRDRNRYAEVFRKMQLDQVYPYLNSMTGLNDPGDVGYENLDKQVLQHDLPEFSAMTTHQVAEALVKQAESAMPSLVEICKALAGSLGMEEVGVGPVKDPGAAIRKAEKKYGGDLLKVTDYCRALLVVKDFPSLLALLELARDSFGPLISRVKMSTLKLDHKPKPGGYRDCIINVELKGHVCEIQVHMWPMWVVCGVDGFRHYRHCVEYNTDSFEDPYDALDGLDRKTMAELIVMAEEAVADTPLDNLEWYHEKYILDYFAEGGLFMKHGLDVWAELTFRHLIRLRTESPDIGPNHHETVVLYKYLAQSLRAQNKQKEARKIMEKVSEAETAKTDEKLEAEKGLWDSFGEVYDMVLDPNRKEREEEEKFRKEVKQSKKHWRHIRRQRFPFLDIDVEAAAEEKKVDG